VTVTVDATTQPVNLTWYGGDTQNQTFRFLTGPDQPWDLSNVYTKATARSTTGQTFELTVGVDPANGLVTIHPPLAGLVPDVYDYDIQMNDGQRTASYIHGRIRVQRDVTQ
jgi:hypothetical protein